jgi:uracil phosphoribosyltransferase
MPLHVVSHPLIADALGRLRDRTTPCDEFRRLARRVSLLLAAEATRDLALTDVAIQTPLERTMGHCMSSRVVAVPVLRAGIGMLEAFLELVPQAEVGYFGLERNEETAAARRYYEKVPKDLARATVFLLDPMLATGGSAAMAVDGLGGLGA